MISSLLKGNERHVCRRVWRHKDTGHCKTRPSEDTLKLMEQYKTTRQDKTGLDQTHDRRREESRSKERDTANCDEDMFISPSNNEEIKVFQSFQSCRVGGPTIHEGKY